MKDEKGIGIFQKNEEINLMKEVMNEKPNKEYIIKQLTSFNGQQLNQLWRKTLMLNRMIEEVLDMQRKQRELKDNLKIKYLDTGAVLNSCSAFKKTKGKKK